MTRDNSAETTPVFIVQSVIMFKAFSVLRKMRIDSTTRNTGGGRLKKWINILFEACTARPQEKDHTRTYDEIRCCLTCEPREHKPFVLPHEDGRYRGPKSVD